MFLGLTKTSEMPEDFESDFKGTWSAAFSNIVKPEKQDSWNKESAKYFVLDQSVESKRKPGLLKPEFVSTNGTFYALAPKSYYLTENVNDQVKVKKGAKGNLCHGINVQKIIDIFRNRRCV